MPMPEIRTDLFAIVEDYRFRNASRANYLGRATARDKSFPFARTAKKDTAPAAHRYLPSEKYPCAAAAIGR
jgi:hypothetical protein